MRLWIETRGRNKQKLILLPQSEAREAEELARLERKMAWIGVPCLVLTILLSLWLLFYHLGCWGIVPLAAVLALRYFWP